MNLKDLILELMGFYLEHGDVEVLRYNTCCCYGDDETDFDTVELKQITGFEPYVLIG